MIRMSTAKLGLALSLALAIAAAIASKPAGASQQTDVQLPSTPLKFGAFVAHFDTDGAFKLEGTGWPAFSGNWKRTGDELELVTAKGPRGCDGPGRYRVRPEGKRLTFD